MEDNCEHKWFYSFLLTLLMTASLASISRILNQIPMFSARSATARRVSHTNFFASSRISTQLLSRANSGARGKAATKMVMKPNWSTEKRQSADKPPKYIGGILRNGLIVKSLET